MDPGLIAELGIGIQRFRQLVVCKQNLDCIYQCPLLIPHTRTAMVRAWTVE